MIDILFIFDKFSVESEIFWDKGSRRRYYDFTFSVPMSE